MARSTIVILTNSDDPHADVMVESLLRAGHEPVRLNTDHLPSGAPLGLTLNQGVWTGGLQITANRRRIDVTTVRSVWVRRPDAFGWPAEMDAAERAFATAELDHALNGMWASLDCYWMSSPAAIRAAGWKPEQLQRAARLGFDVPRTLITTDPEEVRDFNDRYPAGIVFKSMAGPSALAAHARVTGAQLAPGALPTTLIGERELAELDAVHTTACLFQEHIEKRHEIRATVIGDEVFAAEIHSQADPRTRVDFRHFDVDIPYRRARLPEKIETGCLEFVHSYGLSFGAIDIIVTPDDRYVFVENNPVGQFMFVERLVPELRMTDALAACLIRGRNGA